MAGGASFAYNYLLSSLIELSAPPSPNFVPFDLTPMENDASFGQPTKPRLVSRDQLGFSFEEPVFTPIIPDIHIVEPSTPDRNDSRNSSEERSNGFVDVEQPINDEEKAPEVEENKEKEEQEGEIVEDMTVSSSPLNRRHVIRPADQMTPTNVDDDSVAGMEVLNRILTKPTQPTAPPNAQEEIPPSPILLLPPDNNEMTIERMPTVQFTPEVILQHELQEAAAAAAADNRRFWDRCCSIM